MEEGFEYVGHDVAAFSNVPSYEECAKYCFNSSDCKVWSYQNESGYCYLKSNDRNRAAVGGTISGTKVCGKSEFIVI